MKMNLSRFLVVALASALLISANASADRLSEIAAPISNPTVFEDPRIDTSLKPIFIYHALDNKFITGGGNVRIYALQARFAVTDDLGIIATKDGYVQTRPDGVLNDEDGWANLGVGLKYALYTDKEAGDIFSAGLRYEIPSGEQKVLEGNGDGSFNPFVSAATTLGAVNLLASTGFRFAVDSNDSSFYDFNLHADTAIGGVIHPLIEFNVINVVDAGNRLPIADEGGDFFNLGASASDGKTIVTGAVGARADVSDTVSLGVAYQFPLSTGEGSNIVDWRLTTDAIVKF